MDLAQVINELWKRRGWLAIGLAIALFVGLSTAYRISILPPGLEQKSLSIGAADTQILIDTPDSSLTDLGVGLEPLAERAGVFARFMTSRPVRAAIAREVGLKEQELHTEAPLSDGSAALREPAQAKRSNELLGENRDYRLRFATDSGLPTVTIQAQAPRAVDAVRLADAGAAGFAEYVKAVQAKQKVPPERRVTIRQLGNAEGGTIAEEINRPLALLTALGFFIGFCLLVLLGSNLSKSLRELRAAEAAEGKTA